MIRYCNYVFVSDGTALKRTTDLSTWTTMTAPGGTIQSVLRPKRGGMVVKTTPAPKTPREVRMLEDQASGRQVPHELNAEGGWVPMKVKGWEDTAPTLSTTPVKPAQKKARDLLSSF